MKRLYIIHGWTYTVEPWEKTLTILRGRGMQIKMLKVPGLTEPSKKAWTIEDYVKWADRELPDGCVALGHSNGGRILLNLLSQKPEKLKHLILLDAAGVEHQSKKVSWWRKWAKKLKFLKKNKFLRKIVHRLSGASDYARAPENMKQTLVNMLESDKELDLSVIKTETSILWGEEDKVTPVEDAKIMHQKLENSTLTIMPKWGHAPYITHAAGLATEIERLMEKI